jgi:hypothetical protein
VPERQSELRTLVVIGCALAGLLFRTMLHEVSSVEQPVHDEESAGGMVAE